MTEETSLEDGPLTGLRVVEFGQLIAGPYVGTLLAADDCRRLARALLDRRRRRRELPPRHDGEMGTRPGRRPRGQPGCVYARISGYGRTGRYRDRPGFASAGEAIGGLRYINGYPGQTPPRAGISSDDRWVVIAANHDTHWRRLAELMGRAELADDERFATHTARGENQEELDAMVAECASGHTAEELDRIVNEAGVVCAPVYSVADIYDDPCFRERKLLVELGDDVHGPMSVPGVVPKLTDTPGRIRRPARWEVGADTSDVLGDLSDEIEGLDLPRRERVA